LGDLQVDQVDEVDLSHQQVEKVDQVDLGRQQVDEVDQVDLGHLQVDEVDQVDLGSVRASLRNLACTHAARYEHHELVRIKLLASRLLFLFSIKLSRLRINRALSWARTWFETCVAPR
jgi:excinuclease UvrABC ATPase subunit